MSSERIARRYYDLFNDRRLDEAEQLVDPQGVFHYLPTRQRLVGRAGYRALAAAWLEAFADARLEVTSLHPLDDHVVRVEFVGRGTHTGSLVLGDSLEIAATGVAAALPFRDRLDVRGGLIVTSELDFDVQEMKRRLLGPKADLM